jgi:hypothetical protein
MTAALIKGDENAWDVLKEGVLTKMREMVPNHRE